MTISRSLRRRIWMTAAGAVAAFGALAMTPGAGHAAVPASTEVRVVDAKAVPPTAYEPIVGTWEGDLLGTPYSMTVFPLTATHFQGLSLSPEAGCVLLTVSGKGFNYSGTGFPQNCDGTGSSFALTVKISLDRQVMTIHASEGDVPLVLRLNRVS
ncbi:hypothetical protein ABTX15_32730 [Micromonospora sp. NPDC094482]|uniref:hypothetical protein n=1 Tax=unclassified Micromonospora TaxID=2617518 RepID=UPI0033290E33